MSSQARAGPSALGRFAAVWGIAGVLLLLGQAVFRLAQVAWQGLQGDLSGAQWGVLAGFVLFMAYAEGHRGFHRQFSPRVVARARHLALHPRTLHVILAPPFCMGLLHATRKRLIVSWSLLTGIIGLVLLVRTVAQPWRGIVDAGVVVGLLWGMVSVLHYVRVALTGGDLPVPPELPATVAAGGADPQPAAGR